MVTDREELARRLRDDLSVHIEIARVAGFDALAYLLELARMEAEQHTGRNRV